MSHDLSSHHEKAQAAFSSVLWSLFLTGIKIWAGVATNSLGILSEALHSGLDFCAAAITFYAVKVAAIPPDKSHPYGHEKVENLSALVETVLLVVTCIWISWEAIERIFIKTSEINLTWWAFAVVAISLVVDVNRASMLRRVAKKHKSQALEADALHFTTDIWSSAVVLVGLVCVWTAGYLAPESIWRTILLKADSVAALFVAGLILHVSWGLSKRAVHALMDGSSPEETAKIRQILEKEFPSYPIRQLRLRGSGAKLFVDLTMEMPSCLHIDDAHALTERIETIISEAIPEAESLIHIEPVDFLATHTDDELARHIALRYDILIHSFNIMQTTRGRLLKLDIELPDNETLAGTSDRTSKFHKELLHALKLYKLILHIEPLVRNTGTDGINRDSFPTDQEITRIIREKLATFPGILGMESIDLEDLRETCMITVHCAVNSQTTIADSHELATTLEHKLRHVLPQIPTIVVILQPK